MTFPLIETVEYKNHLIEIYHDGSCSEPELYEDFAMLTYSYELREHNEMPELYKLLDAKFHKLKRDIQISDGWGNRQTLHERQKEIAEKDGCGMIEARSIAVDEFCDAVSANGWQSAVNYFEVLETALTANDYDCEIKTHYGDCQGDAILTLTVVLEKTQPQVSDTLHDSIGSEYANWAFGRCYGYQIRRAGSCQCCAEILDSCWGFIGYPDDSGLLEEAKTYIDYECGEGITSEYGYPKTSKQ